MMVMVLIKVMFVYMNEMAMHGFSVGVILTAKLMATGLVGQFHYLPMVLL